MENKYSPKGLNKLASFPLKACKNFCLNWHLGSPFVRTFPMKIMLITPPMTQINTPYPATGYLCSYLLELGYEVTQRDLGLDLFHKVFSEAGLNRIKAVILNKKEISDLEAFFLEAFSDYEKTINPVIRFMQGQDPSLALRISRRQFVPEGPRFMPLNEFDNLLEAFGPMGTHDQAKYIASLYLDDLADIVKLAIDERFEFSRYGESLASSQSSFNHLYNGLKTKTLIDEMLEECIAKYMTEYGPDAVGFTLPFPGNVYATLRASRYLKAHHPKIITIAGGGFVNTELREMSDVRFFEFINYLIFDDGEHPLKLLLEYLEGNKNKSDLLRTWYLENNEITRSNAISKDIPFKNLSGPTYKGLDLKAYVPMMEMPNPMHRMWSDFRWNKMILAHGCYWKKCTFCDVSLDYIDRYEPARVETLISSIENLIKETGQTGFHFVDEAAPPALVKSLSQSLIDKNMKISWWGNLRFDKQFEHLANIMADSGCVAVTGGLEVASPRVLKMIDKGTTVEQVARVTKAFSDAGIFVHSYLMYGFPSQTLQETVDSLEVVRQLFLNECIHSGYWHRFMATAHSPVGKNPDQYGIKIHPIETPKEGLFAKNTLYFDDSVYVELDMVGDALKKALYNYMHGLGLDEDVRAWFEAEVPKTQISKNYIKNILK